MHASLKLTRRKHRVGAIMVALAITTSALSVATPGSAARASVPDLVQTNFFSVGEDSRDIVVDSATDTIYSQDPTQNRIEVVDDLTDTLSSIIPVNMEPGGWFGLALDTSSNVLWVNNTTSGIQSFNASTGALIGSVALPAEVSGIAVDSTTHELYATMYATDSQGPSVVAINGTTDAVDGIVILPVTSISSGIDPSTGTLYTLGNYPDLSNYPSYSLMSMVELSSMTLTTSIHVPASSNTLAVDAATHTVFAGNTTTLTVVDGTNFTIEREIAKASYSFVVDSADGVLYDAGEPEFIQVIDWASGNVVDTIRSTIPMTLQAMDTTTGNIFGVDDAIGVLSKRIAITSPAPDSLLPPFVDFSATVTVSAPTAVSWSLTGNLPPGLSFDPSTAVISGTPTTSGSYTYTVTALDAIGGAVSAKYTQTVGVATVRAAGSDRFQTSIAVSQDSYPAPETTPVVFIADGMNYPDALSAGPAAATLGGPVLLVEPTVIPSEIVTEIKRLAPSTIVVVGGTASVSNAVLNKLKAYAPRVVREGGSNRFQTSQLVDEYAFGDDAPGVVISTGNSFPDAISAGAAAAALDAPLLLVNGALRSEDASTRQALTQLAATTVLVVSSASNVSDGFFDGLAESYGDNAVEVSGPYPSATELYLNEGLWGITAGEPEPPLSNEMFLATGTNFPDSLVAGAWAGIEEAPLYQLPGTCVYEEVLDDMTGLGTSLAVIVGGTGSLTAAVDSLQPCYGEPPIALPVYEISASHTATSVNIRELFAMAGKARTTGGRARVE